MKMSKTALRRIIVAVLAVCMMMGLMVTAQASDEEVRGVAECVLQVSISPKDAITGKENRDYRYVGTGFLINEDTLITCYHVVDPVTNLQLLYDLYGNSIFGMTADDLVSMMEKETVLTVSVTNDVTIPCTVINGSEEMDFAIVKLSQPILNRKYVKIRNSAEVTQAETVYALGFPVASDSGHAVTTYTKDDVTITMGAISKSQSLFDFSNLGTKGQFLQTDVNINGGNSGGPLVDAHGNVIGIAAISNSSAGYAYAVAIDQVTEVLDALGITWTKEGYNPEPQPASDTPAIDTSKLQSLIEQARAIDTKLYSKGQQKEVNDFEAALYSAKSELENPTDQMKVDDRAAELEKAINRLGEPKQSNSLPIIIAAIAAVAVIAVVLVLMNSKKKAPAAAAARPAAARPAPATAPAPARPAAPATAAFSNAAPQAARPTPAAPPVGDSGATTILQGKLEATTVLANGGSITRVKNGDKLDLRIQEVLVGRDPASCNFYISGNSNIGRRHAKFVVKNGTTFVVDCNSTNGTFVNGTRLQSNVETALKDGDKITLADEDFRFNK